jgi:O-antigen/teichoic acid export membrane protein
MRALLPSAVQYVRLAFGKGQVVGDAQRRYVRIVRGIFTGLAGRAVAVVVSFISIPLTVRYLGAERYGAWVTISAAMAWIALADLGLSNSLTNAVSEGYANDRRDLAQDSVAAAFWSLVGIAVVLALAFFSLWTKVPWDRIFNVQTAQARAEVGPAVAFAFAIFVLNFPFSIISKIYGAYQEVAIANGWAAAGNVLGLAALIAVTRLRGGLVALVIAVSSMVLLINVISAVWVFGWSKPWLLPSLRRVTWPAVRKLTSLGSMFFVIQAAALVLFQTDNLIIAHYLGSGAVTPYSVTWRLFTYTMLFQMLAIPSFWPAYAEAFSRGDRAWVRRSFRLNFRITIASTGALALPLVLFGRWFIDKWAGKAAVPSSALLVLMGIWSVIYSATCSQSCILGGGSRLRGQMIYSIVAAVVNIVASVLLVQRIGVTGAILGTIIAYAVCVLVPQWIEVERFLNTVHSAPQYEKSDLAESPIRSHSQREGVQETSR